MRTREEVAWLCDRTLAAEWNRMRKARVSSRVTYADVGRHAKPERIGCTRASSHVWVDASGHHFPSLDAYWIRPNPRAQRQVASQERKVTGWLAWACTWADAVGQCQVRLGCVRSTLSRCAESLDHWNRAAHVWSRDTWQRSSDRTLGSLRPVNTITPRC
jgi:hypothetical protein